MIEYESNLFETLEILNINMVLNHLILIGSHTRVSGIKMAETFIWGPEIDRLLEYCKEPKSLFEMVEYLEKYKSKDAFSRNILHPLLEQGRIKRTIPERLAHKFHKYYSVNGENYDKVKNTQINPLS